MISYNSNASDIVTIINNDLKSLSGEEGNKMLRLIASTLTASLHTRVHTEGKDADENPIGTYSDSYMKVRTGNYGNAGQYKSGKNKGKNKNAGVYTKGVNKGQARKKYNRTADKKVILSLTRQMENDLSVCEQEPIKTQYGYAIGYQNEENYDKAMNLEKKYDKKILTKLSKSQEELIDILVEKTLADVITGN